MKCQIFIWLTVVIAIAESTRLRFTSIACFSDPKICKSPICKLKAQNRFEKHLRFGCPLQATVPESWMLIENLRKSSSGYQPGFVRSRLDLCSMLDQKSSNFKLLKSIVNNFAEGFMQQFERQWIPCPFPDHWSLNMSFDERKNYLGPVAGVVPAGDYRVRLWIHTKRSNQTVYEWIMNFIYSK